MPHRLILLLVLAAPAVWAQTAGSPADILGNCAGSEDVSAYGLQELEVQCPGIEHALTELGYAPFLSERQLDELSVYGLEELQRLSARYAERPGAARGIGTATLGPILGTLDEQRRAERPPNWFERFKRWLRDVLQRQQRETPTWLTRWLEDVDVSDTVVRVIVYSMILLVIGLAIVVIVNELRAAGVFRGGRIKRRTHAAVDVSRAAGDLTLADLDAAAPLDRPSVLLRMLVAALAKRGRLRADRSLTHSELTRRAVLDDDGQRARFGEVTRLGERTLYGNARVSLDEIDRVVQAGRELMAQIAASTAQAATLATAQATAARSAGK